jgi:hypothetical protein
VRPSTPGWRNDLYGLGPLSPLRGFFIDPSEPATASAFKLGESVEPPFKRFKPDLVKG